MIIVLRTVRMAFYAVKVGKMPGIYKSWDECKQQIDGYTGCVFRKFKTLSEAENFVKNCKRSNDTSSYNVSKILKTDANEKVTEQCSNELNISEPNGESNSDNSTPTKWYYAVHKGHKPGVYANWPSCRNQVQKFKQPVFRKFSSKEAAQQFVKTGKIAAEKETGSNEESLKACKKAIRNDPSTVTVFTDGASSKNGQHGCAAGIGVYWGPDHPLNTSMRLPGRQTNNRAEIYAATHALRQAKQIGATGVNLYTDSKFLINGITGWIDKWKSNGWRLANGEPVKNKEDFIALDEARSGLDVEFIYVKGHDNNPGNVEADKLAVAGAKMSLTDTSIYLI